MIHDLEGKSKESEDEILEEDFDIVPAGERGKDSWKGHIMNLAIIVLVAMASFGIGRLNFYSNNKVPLEIKYSERVISTEEKGSASKVTSDGEVKGVTVTSVAPSEEVVASKNGTKYHFPWCAGAKQIAEKNKITFPNVESARAAGYTPAANCKGLK